MRASTAVVAAGLVAATALAAADGRARGATAPSVFLCYSRVSGSEPGVWPYAQAEALYRPTDPAVGFYFRPHALEGNTPGGTNLGRWHLVCSAAPPPPPGYRGWYGDSGEYVGGSGELYTAATGAALVRALYPLDLLAMYAVWRLFPCACMEAPR